MMNFEKEKIFQDAIFENENIKKEIPAPLRKKILRILEFPRNLLF